MCDNEGVDLSDSVGTGATLFPIESESPLVDGYLSSDMCHCSSVFSRSISPVAGGLRMFQASASYHRLHSQSPEVNWPTLDIRVVSNLEGQNERYFIYSVPGIERFAATKGKRSKNSSSFQHSG